MHNACHHMTKPQELWNIRWPSFLQILSNKPPRWKSLEVPHIRVLNQLKLLEGVVNWVIAYELTVFHNTSFTQFAAFEMSEKEEMAAMNACWSLHIVSSESLQQLWLFNCITIIFDGSEQKAFTIFGETRRWSCLKGWQIVATEQSRNHRGDSEDVRHTGIYIHSSKATERRTIVKSWTVIVGVPQQRYKPQQWTLCVQLCRQIVKIQC